MRLFGIERWGVDMHVNDLYKMLGAWIADGYGDVDIEIRLGRKVFQFDSTEIVDRKSGEYVIYIPVMNPREVRDGFYGRR